MLKEGEAPRVNTAKIMEQIIGGVVVAVILGLGALLWVIPNNEKQTDILNQKFEAHLVMFVERIAYDTRRWEQTVETNKMQFENLDKTITKNTASTKRAIKRVDDKLNKFTDRVTADFYKPSNGEH